jgi:hypothetical protein
MRAEAILDSLLELALSVRYAAIYPGRGEPIVRQRGGLANPSSAESDRFEELVVNPTLLTLLRQRGNIDCGGLDYVLVRYGRFYQLVLPIRYGHISVCFHENADPIALVPTVRRLCEQHGAL